MVDIRVGGKDYGSGVKELDFAGMEGELDESGTRLTASGGGASGTSATAVAKGGDTARTSTTTLADDPDLTLAVEADKTYLVTGLLHLVAGNTTGDFKFGFSAPAGSAMYWMMDYPNSSGTGSGVRQTLATDSGRVNVTTGGEGVWFRGLVTIGGTAGNLTLQWAQFVSDAATTTLRAGSHLVLSEVSTATP